MPLYEFYCEPCHTVFTFRSHHVDTLTLPECPLCGQQLKREVSRFSHCVKGGEAAREEGTGDFDRMELMGAKLADRLHALERDEADPRDAVRVMRELASAGGVRFNKEVQEAMNRIEAGEDTEQIDEEFQEVFDLENPFEEQDDAETGHQVGDLWRRLHAPKRDPVWHDMPAHD